MKKQTKYSRLIQSLKAAYASKINRKVNILEYNYRKLLEIAEGDDAGIIYIVNWVLIKFIKKYEKRKGSLNGNKNNKC